MSIDPRTINLERHVEIGRLIHQNADALTDRWAERATQEQPAAQAAQRAELRDDLPDFLRALGRAMAESESIAPSRHRLLAVEHGEQRWASGWRLAELVRDYQILRLVILEFLEQELDRPISIREIMAIGLGLDEAIAAASVTYVAYQSNQVREADERIASVVDHALNAIFMINDRGLIESFNPAAEKVFGLSAQAATGLHASGVFPDLSPQAAGDLLVEWFTGGKDAPRTEREAQARRRDGSLFPIDMAASTFHVGGRSYITAIVRDITERKRGERERTEYAEKLEKANRALAAATLEAEAANRYKSEFLASMSHEIRTPMTAILGFAEVLASTLQLPENVEIAQTIKRNGEHLVQIVNDILDLSKIEAGKVELAIEPFSPARVAHEVQALLAGNAQRQGLTLEVAVEPGMPQTIKSDPTRLRQILVNLVSNGIKFTEQGGVRLTLRRVLGAVEPALEFEVADTGIGMTDEQLGQLFAPFAQLHRARGRNVQGAGLGLVISKRIATLLGGEIRVASRPGDGSVFLLRLPWGEESTPDPAADASAATADDNAERELPQLDCRVLLAEDGRDNQAIISRMLEGAGATVFVVDNGRSAVEQVEAALADDLPFDLVLMDMQMPILDGSDATRELRQRGCQLPIVALTASAMKGDREHCLELGCTDYLTKPIDRRLLIQTVSRHARRKT